MNPHPPPREPEGTARKATDEIAVKFFGAPYDALERRAQTITRHVAARIPIARDVGTQLRTEATFGERAADSVARFGGSWLFVGAFMLLLVAWVVTNACLVLMRGRTFDPYPYILLNLFLSMLAAIQAPVILMAQNRQATKDRHSLEHDYEVNLKTELELMLLHEKVDQLREIQWTQLMEVQAEQLRMLARLSSDPGTGVSG